MLRYRPYRDTISSQPTEEPPAELIGNFPKPQSANLPGRIRPCRFGTPFQSTLSIQCKNECNLFYPRHGAHGAKSDPSFRNVTHHATVIRTQLDVHQLGRFYSCRLASFSFHFSLLSTQASHFGQNAQRTEKKAQASHRYLSSMQILSLFAMPDFTFTSEFPF